jgi:hypothetical protein
MSSKGQKHAAGGIVGGQSKKHRKVMTLEQKLDVLKQYMNNEKACDVRVTGLNYAMLHTIRADVAKIRASYASATPAIMESMENMFAIWIETQVKRNSSANIMAIRAKSF